jgi:hypothetical protein
MIDGMQDMQARQPALVRTRPHGVKDFGRNNHLLPASKVIQRSPEHHLAHPIRVHVGGIEEVHPQFEGTLDKRTAFGFI